MGAPTTLWDMHRTTESWNIQGWKGPTRINKPNSWPHTGLLNNPTLGLRVLSGRLGAVTIPWAACSGPSGEGPFPDIQHKTLLTQLQPQVLSLVIREKRSVSLLFPSPEIVGCKEVSPQPPPFQAEQTKCPPHLPLKQLQILHHLHCPPLNTLQEFNISLTLQ